MRNSALKRCLFFGILIAGSIVGGLVSCGRKETFLQKKEAHPQEVFIDGELQWEAGLSWDFFPWNGNADSGKTGCFVSEERRKQRMKATKQEIQETLDIWQNKETIEVYHNTLSEEDFFLLINNRAKELVEKYPEEEVVYRINGSTEIDQFVDSELDYMAYVDSEMRRLYFHFYFLQIYGLEVTYQWKNEMDYEVTKKFLHDKAEGGVLVKISRYEDGKEELLSDYIYSYEEYTERDDIWGTYYEDFIWEKEITDRSTGKKYMIRYAEVFLPEEAERNKGIYYDGRIYVYDENTYLVSVTHSEIISKSESITWEDGDGDKVQAVVICYDDGGKSVFYLSGLVQPDYQSDAL